MISHQDKCIFVHIPKAAGQSIEDVFVKRMGLTWEQREALLLKPNNNPALGPPRLAHLFANEYINKGHIEQPLFDEYFKFSFIRNPWSRLVSEFNYRKKLGHSGYQNGFRNFILNHFPEPENDTFNNGRDNYRHVVPQSQFLIDSSGKQLVDFIGRFETLQQDFDYVCNQLNLGTIKLEHKNKTYNNIWFEKIKKALGQSAINTKKFTEYYDEDTYQFVEHYYQEDINNFKYTFENK
jgi:hypothetical protein